MRTMHHKLFAVFALLAANPAMGQAPTGTAPASFDGTYAGVSAEFRGAMNQGQRAISNCATFAAPAPLTISQGHAQTKWGSGTLQGDVTAQGVLILHSDLAGRFEGQIDTQGGLKGQYTGYCAYTLAWQKRR